MQADAASNAARSARASDPAPTPTPTPKTPTPDELARQQALGAYLRAENEDDDGYDPYSDRPAAAEPLFERDPWS